MRKSNRRLVILLAVSPAWLVALAAAAWVVNSWLVNRQASAFDAIQEGSRRSQVVGALGRPDRVRSCGENLWWGDDAHYRGKNDGRCVIEERYEHFLTAFGVGYSEQGIVVSKYKYVSE